MSCKMHCDNCAGQNKNRFVLAYLAWRVLTGLHREITLSMQIPGHTKCLVDAGFSYIKKLYRRADNDSLQDLANVVQKSARGNNAIVVNNGFCWYDWKTFLSTDFSPLSGIRKYHHFRLSAMQPGVVFVKEKYTDPERAINILRNEDAIFSAANLPPILEKGGLSAERKLYLFNQIRPYVQDHAKDLTCPPPDEE